VLTLCQIPHDLKRWRILLVVIFFETALDLTFVDYIEMVALVALVEDEVARVYLHKLETVDQLEFVVLVQASEELDLFEVLEVDVTPADRVLSDDLLENVAGEDPSLTVIDSCNVSRTFVVV